MPNLMANAFQKLGFERVGSPGKGGWSFGGVEGLGVLFAWSVLWSVYYSDLFLSYYLSILLCGVVWFLSTMIILMCWCFDGGCWVHTCSWDDGACSTCVRFYVNCMNACMLCVGHEAGLDKPDSSFDQAISSLWSFGCGVRWCLEWWTSSLDAAREHLRGVVRAAEAMFLFRKYDHGQCLRRRRCVLRGFPSLT